MCRQPGHSQDSTRVSVLIPVVATPVEAAVEASTQSVEKVMLVHLAEVEVDRRAAGTALRICKALTDIFPFVSAERLFRSVASSIIELSV